MNGSDRWAVFEGDSRRVLRGLEDGFAQCVVTSPPYWGMRNYGDAKRQIGLEKTLDKYIRSLVEVFRETRRVLARDGVLWLNLGDRYVAKPPGTLTGSSKLASQRNQESVRKAAHQPKFDLPEGNLIGIPWSVAFALRADGWILRSEVIWEKVLHKPDGAKSRPTTAHEHLFLFSKSKRYQYDADAIAEKCSTSLQLRNKRTIWRIVGTNHKGDHDATFPPELVEPCILAGARIGSVVLDPFAGSGTVGEVAIRQGRRFVGVDVVPRNCVDMRDRFHKVIEKLGDYTPANAPKRATQLGLFPR